MSTTSTLLFQCTKHPWCRSDKAVAYYATTQQGVDYYKLHIEDYIHDLHIVASRESSSKVLLHTSWTSDVYYTLDFCAREEESYVDMIRYASDTCDLDIGWIEVATV